MPRFKVAHVNQSGIDLIIIPVESAFGNMPIQSQLATSADIQNHADSAGLRGTVVPVWDAGLGRMGYLAPTNWHPFFNSINLQWVWANINRELFW